MLIFDSGDPGGDRLINKVYNYLSQFYNCIYVGPNQENYAETKVFESLSENELLKVKCYIFSSSVKSKKYLKRISKFKELGIHTLHILDSWSNYIERFIENEEILIFPDTYLVPDKLAYEEAILQGVPQNILQISGNPLFSKLQSQIVNYTKDFKILFISEPAADDRAFNKKACYYSQFDVFQTLVQEVNGLNYKKESEPKIFIKPHPREDLFAWFDFVKQNNYSATILGNDNLELSEYCVIYGVNSILLYEAWLLGLQVVVPKKFFSMSHMKARIGVRKSLENRYENTDNQALSSLESILTKARNQHKYSFINILHVLKSLENRTGDIIE